MDPLAVEVDGLCSAARGELMLVAPFIKEAVLTRLLNAVAVSVDIRVVTRWRPQEIKAGVSDIEIWDAVKARPRTTLLLRPDLHAKYYRADSNCLVGSANLTQAGLGLSRTPNLELLLPVGSTHMGLKGFEVRLLAGAVLVDDHIVDLTRAAVAILPDVPIFEDLQQWSDRGTGVDVIGEAETWVPTLRQPEDLFMAYAGHGEALSQVSLRAAAADLSILWIPTGLDEPAFDACVGLALMCMPLFVAVDGFVSEPRRFGEMRDLLSRMRASSESSSRDWQVMYRWLMHFLPERFDYRRPNHSELIARR
jgi:hypothetical protein